MRNGFVGVIGYSLLTLLIGWGVVRGLPPCGTARPTTITRPWSGTGDLWCLEQVVSQPETGPIGYTALATGADGTLYAVMPDAGKLVRFADTDADGLPDMPVTLADGLTRPTGLTTADGQVYVSTLGAIYRYDLAADALSVLVADFPGGWAGYPSGGLLAYDGWLYAGAGGDRACTNGRGAVWRYRLDGTDGQQVATGLRAPSALAFHSGRLVIVDTATDRLWALEPGADYGACSGGAPPGAPLYTFEAGGAPNALASYPGDLFPVLAGRLLVGLRGSVGTVIVPGYEVLAVDLSGGQPPEAVLPRNPPHLNVSDQRMHIQGSGFYPHHVYGVAVSPEGWVYVSAGNGNIVALRPL